MKKLALLTILVLGVYFTAEAQDKIYKKGGEVIEVKVTEVGTDEIKYKIFKSQEGPVYTIEKARILKVVYQGGRVEIYQSTPMNDPELYNDQAKNAIKVNFLSPLLGYTQLNFEHNIKPGRSYELALGIVGLGKRQVIESMNFGTGYQDVYREQSGAYVGAGYKLSKLPDYVSGKERYSHVMQGFYAKPEFLIGLYSENVRKFASSTTSSSPIEKRSTFFTALMVNVGKQWVLGELMVLDLSAGLGYVVDNLHPSKGTVGETGYYENDFVGHHFAVITGGADSGLGFSGGIKIGVLLNKKKK